MVKLTEEMRDTFSKVKTFSVATASKDGEPNVVPIGMIWLQDDSETIWLADNFMNKTLANLRENPRLSLNVWDRESDLSYQIKCDVEILSEGGEFQQMKDKVKARNPKMPAKNLIRAHVTDVFCTDPGPGAGKRLL